MELIAMATISVAALVALALEYKSHRKTKKELQRIRQNPDDSLKVLSDIMNNHGVVLKVERVDPSDIFLRSPRGQ